MNKLTPIFIAGALAISAGLAIAQTSMNKDDPMQGHNMAGMTAPGAATDSPSTTAYLAANDRMHKDMTVDFTGDADIDFMRAMIPHHQGAIDMAKAELEHGDDPWVREMAQKVITAQEQEIKDMIAWLEQQAQ